MNKTPVYCWPFNYKRWSTVNVTEQSPPHPAPLQPGRRELTPSHPCPSQTTKRSCPRITPSLRRSRRKSFITSIWLTPGTQWVISFTVGISPSPLSIEKKKKQCSKFLTGIVVTLYFECAVAILNPPPNRRRGRKWGLLAYTTFLFVLGTIFTGCNLRVRQLSYIDNRGFPGKPPSLPPGPIGYTLLSQSKPTSMLSNASFTVANWMADGLLVSP